MTLPFVVDRRTALAGQPATHALIIGVAAYDKLRPLSAGAHTAARICEWLLEKAAKDQLPARRRG